MKQKHRLSNIYNESNRQSDQEVQQQKNSQNYDKTMQILHTNSQLLKLSIKTIVFRIYDYEEPSIVFTSLIKSLSNNLDYLSLHMYSSFLSFFTMLMAIIASESHYNMAQNPNYLLVFGFLFLIKFIQEFDYFHNKERLSFTDVYLGLIFRTISRTWTIKLILQTFQSHYLTQTLILFTLGPMFFSFEAIILTLQKQRFISYFVKNKTYKIIKSLSIQNAYTVSIFLGIYYFLPQFQYKNFYQLKLFSICIFFSVVELFYFFSVLLAEKVQNFQWQTSKQLFKRIFCVYSIIFLLIQIYVVKNHFFTHPIIRLLLQINLCLFVAVLIGKKQLQRLIKIRQKTFSFQSCLFFINISLMIVWGLLNKKYNEQDQLQILKQVLKLLTVINILSTLFQMRKCLKSIII